MNNILSFRRGPTRENSIRTSQYQVKMERETRFRQVLVTRLEEALFSNRGHTSPGESIPFLQSETIFTCSTGVIRYYYCREKQAHLLTDFSLDDGGNGGQPLSCPSNTDEFYVTAAVVGWARDLAALAIVTCRYRFSLIALKIGIYRIRPIFTHWLARVRRANANVVREVVMLKRLINSSQSDVYPTALPSWSMLRHFVSVPEQLDNLYARSILAGEALARLGGEIDLASLGCRRGAGEQCKYRLLEDSYAVIEALLSSNGSPTAPKALRYFTTGFLFDKERLNDDRRLELIRSEMTLRIAAALARHASALVPGLQDKELSAENRHQCLQLMHSFSRLSDFVRLSNTYFGTQRWASEDLTTVSELPNVKPAHRHEILCFLAGLSEFGASSHTVVYLMTSTDGTNSDPENVAEIRDRLAALASEILDPTG